MFTNQSIRFDAAFGPRPASIHISGVISLNDEMCCANLLVALEPISGIEKAGNRVIRSTLFDFCISLCSFVPSFSESKHNDISSWDSE